MAEVEDQQVLWDRSNTEAVQTAQRFKPLVTKTFSRKKKANPQEETALAPLLEAEHGAVSVSVRSASDSAYDAAGSPTEGAALALLSKAQRRKAMPTAYQHEAAIRAKYLANLRAHFAEVDAFQLVEESPSPAACKSKARIAKPASPQQLTARPEPSQHSQAEPSQLSSNGSTSPVRDAQTWHASPPGSAAGLLEEEPDDPGQSAGAAVQSYAHLLASPGTPQPPAFPTPSAQSPHNTIQASSDQPRPTSSPAAPAIKPASTPARDSDSPVDSPDGKGLHASRHMSLGMSRRASVCIVHPPDEDFDQQQPRHAAARRSTLSRASISDSLARLSLGVAEHAQRSRLSQRTSDIAPTLQHAAQRRATMQPAISEHFMPPAGVSPIAESPDSARIPDRAHADASTPPSASAPVVSLPCTCEGAAEMPETRQMQQLSLEDPAETAAAQPEADAAGPDAALTPMQALLQLAGQAEEADDLPSMDALLQRFDSLQRVRKLGEGTFGEAFGTGKAVFKIIPLGGARLVNGEVQKTAEEILAEAAITMELSCMRDAETAEGQPRQNVTTGFVELYGLGVCQGRYSAALTKEWHAWDDCHDSENDPVDGFDHDQTYIVYITADGGLDLEHLELRSFGEAKSILLQVALTLAVAEEACRFEHRDLHWGNVLVRRCSCHRLPFRLRGVDVEVVSEGVEVVLIDFTLSRLHTPTGDVQFCDLAKDAWLFEQPKGDCQADTYRRMRQKTNDDWEGFHPVTNALWMHYLTEVVLSYKKLRCTAAETRALRGFRKRALSYASCSEAVWDNFFQGQWLTGTK